ncbi:erythromycin esterase family protein [Paraburkholderia sp. BCC1884]|uniref:erythromycin esterase family protein n=1 Tax=Paraburkholderia sp. BCC1884 TaxID=2562668 RepID=UPI0011821171|nr:erythromycin esterase family protein [Paraburkholderia sp. BCC1884]
MADSGRDEFIRWARDACHPLLNTGATTGTVDIEPLRVIVGNASIVGLGESWHSSAQLLTMKNELVLALVDHFGFNAIAFEGGVPASNDVDAYLRGDTENTPAAVLRKFGQPMWLNPQTVALMESLRTWNASRGAQDPIRAFGVDPAYPGAAIGSVLSYLGRVEPDYRPPYRDLLLSVEHALLAVPLDSSAKSAVWGSTAVYEALNTTEKEQFRFACTELISQLEQNRSAYSFRTSAAEFEWALRQVIVILQAHGIVSVRSRSLTEANRVRDLAFAENLVWMRDQSDSPLKIIVLAHNIHIAREPFRSAPDGPPIVSMGGYLSDWLGDEYVAIGSTVGRGRHGGDSDAGLAVVPATDAGKLASADASNDAALEEVGVGRFMLPLSGAPAWASTARTTRSHLEPQPEYALARSFDAVAYVDRITRSEPLRT